MTALADGAAQYTSFNSPKGRMLANFVLWREAADDFRALLPGDLAGADRKSASRMFVLRSKVTLADVSADLARFGVGGPKAAEALRAAFGDGAATYWPSCARTTRRCSGLPGPRYVVLAPAEPAAATGERLARARRCARRSPSGNG